MLFCRIVCERAGAVNNSRSKKQQGVVKVSTSFLYGKNSHFNHNSFVIYKFVKSLKILRTWKISMVLDAASSQF